MNKAVVKMLMPLFSSDKKAIKTQQGQALVTLAGSVRSTCAEQRIFPRRVDGSRQEDKHLGLVCD